jgi:uncharacterized protein YlaI
LIIGIYGDEAILSSSQLRNWPIVVVCNNCSSSVAATSLNVFFFGNIFVG